MKRSGSAGIRIILLAILLVFLCAGAAADGPAFNSYDAALKYVRENQPQELDVGTVRWQPAALLKLKEEMGSGAVLCFTTNWGGMTLNDKNTEINLNEVKRITAEDVEAVINLCPEVQKINLTEHYYLRNKPITELMEKYPGIEFVWTVTIRGKHKIATDCTAYSTFHEPEEPEKLKSEDLEVLQYVHGLKALDLGHNAITSLDFLKYCPELELLILGDNRGITDITPIGNLTHLQYLELFSTGTADLSPLANCRELIDLNLCYDMKVTDLSALEGLTKLERFWGNHMDGLTAEETERFTALHTGTECVFNGKHATSEGWREHERYEHYRWCLKNQVWIPFSEPLPGK